MSDDGDRRRFARELCLTSAVIRQGKQIHQATIHDIAENGMFVAIDEIIPIGAGVQVRFKHPWTDEMTTARAVVMRRNPKGGSEGPATGFGVQLLTTLSDLEDAEAISTSATIPPELMADAQKLRNRAILSRPPAPRDGKAASFQSMPPRSKSRRRGRRVVYNGVESGETEGLLRRIADETVVVAGRRIPTVGRLIRVTIDGPTPEAPTLGLAGKVIWNSSEYEREGGLDQFEISILHFLSSGDEERYRALLRQAKRARAARRS